jgi:uncharacterized protein (TIGR02996 family)
MNDGAALLAAICAQPDEDTPRLAFADYLDEAGGAADAARAEFIRIQVERSRLAPDDPRGPGLFRREAELWVAHRRDWRAALPDLWWLNWRGYERGFLTVIDADQMEPFVRHAPEVFAAAPVQCVCIRRADPNVTRDLAFLPELIHLRELDLTGCLALTDGDVATLAGSPGLGNLHALRLGGNPIGADGERALARSRYLRNLRRLEVHRVGDAVLEELRQAFPPGVVR